MTLDIPMKIKQFIATGLRYCCQKISCDKFTELFLSKKLAENTFGGILDPKTRDDEVEKIVTQSLSL